MFERIGTSNTHQTTIIDPEETLQVRYDRDMAEKNQARIGKKNVTSAGLPLEQADEPPKGEKPHPAGVGSSTYTNPL